MADMARKQQGLTLIELMVTLAVAIILIAVGMPMYNGMAANNRAASQANTFLTAFKLARSEAVKRSTPVSVCAVANPNAAPITCGTNAQWGNGMLVFTDGSTGNTVTINNRLKVFTINTAGATVVTPGAFVRFGPRGDIAPNGIAAPTGTPPCSSATCFQLGHADTTGTPNRCLHVLQSGQIRLERAACS